MSDKTTQSSFSGEENAIATGLNLPNPIMPPPAGNWGILTAKETVSFDSNIRPIFSVASRYFADVEDDNALEVTSPDIEIDPLTGQTSDRTNILKPHRKHSDRIFPLIGATRESILNQKRSHPSQNHDNPPFGQNTIADTLKIPNKDSFANKSSLTELKQTQAKSSRKIPQNPFTSGAFVVGQTGKIGFDFLFDGGKYKSEVAIFSLEGMEAFEFGSIAFIQEAARRALHGSHLGHVAIRDRVEGAKFDGKLGERSWNKGEYKGVKTFEMRPGDRFGIMLIPNGTVKQIYKKPNSKGARKPLFSLATEGNDFGQIADLTGEGHTFAMEDVHPHHQWFDRDYNDIIFQVSGATAKTQSLDKAISPEKDWRKTDLGQEIIQYVEENNPNRPKFPIDPETGVLYKPGELLIKFTTNTNDIKIQALANQYGAIAFENLVPFDPQSNSPLQQWQLFHFDPTLDLPSIRDRIAKEDRIEAIELNMLRFPAWTPNDSRFQEMWGLHNTGQNGGAIDADIDAPEAWEIQRKNKDVIVAVIDSGINYNHPDLIDNMWQNSGEIAGNGIDDDGNGHTDDIYGYDFGEGDADPLDLSGHGTHVAGTIGASGNNNLGVIGVSPNVSLMSVKSSDDVWGVSSAASVGWAIDYAVRMGADIINASLGGRSYSQFEFDKLSFANDNGVLVVAAAGNDRRNNDVIPNYPSNYDLPNIISVAATDRDDNLAIFDYAPGSNYGETTVDLGAPGKIILSTSLENPWSGEIYDFREGTSMATPHVAGAAALLLAQNPNLTPENIKKILMDTGDNLASLQGKTVSGKRLNLHQALQAVISMPSEPSVRVIGDPFQFGSGDPDYSSGFPEDANRSVLSLSDRSLVTVWGKPQLYAGQYSIFGQRYDRRGNPLGDRFVVDSGDIYDFRSSNLSITELNNNEFLVTWDDLNNKIYGQRYDINANKISDRLEIDTNSSLKIKKSSVTALSDGKFAITWQEENLNGDIQKIYATQRDFDGSSIGEKFQIYSSQTNEEVANPIIATLENNKFMVTWQSWNQNEDKSSIYGLLYDREDHTLGNIFQVKTDKIERINSYRSNYRVKTLENSNIFIVGENFDGIFGQHYDRQGNPLGNQFQISKQGFLPSLTTLGTGETLAAWVVNVGGYGGEFKIHGQLYNNNGEPVGKEFSLLDQHSAVSRISNYMDIVSLSEDRLILTLGLISPRAGVGFHLKSQYLEIDRTPDYSIFQTPVFSYRSFEDSPFKDANLTDFYLEDFEDGLLNTLGVDTLTGSIASPSSTTNSVDGDDGTIDGTGQNGYSWRIEQDSIQFNFDRDILGNFPTHAGVVLTNRGTFTLNSQLNPGGISGMTLEAFDARGISLGISQAQLGVYNSDSSNDRFFGAVHPSGISSIVLKHELYTNWEIDHLQYGIL
ncbi:MAG: S8 family serine peptidase [Cyanobacteria bacterium P01_E01_bin.42]